MPGTRSQNMEAKKRNLKVLQAEFQKRKGDMRDMFKQKMRLLKGVRSKIRKVEAELVEADVELSDKFSSGSSVAVGSSSSSDSEKSDQDLPPTNTANIAEAATRKVTMERSDKPVSKDIAPSSSEKPVPPSKGVDASKDAAGGTGSARQRRPPVPPGEAAPNHYGKPNRNGDLYPGFAKGEPKFCPACDQLRRGFKNATRAHKPTDGSVCEWAPRCRSKKD